MQQTVGFIRSDDGGEAMFTTEVERPRMHGLMGGQKILASR
ncbi:cold shock CspA family protein [Rhizobium ruizarguesonis]|jgi:cold shock CspA family protein